MSPKVRQKVINERNTTRELYEQLKQRAEQELGFPLKVQDDSRGFPYMTLDLVPVQIMAAEAGSIVMDEVRFAVELRWRGLTVAQVQQLRALLQGSVPGADPTFLPGYPNDPPRGA